MRKCSQKRADEQSALFFAYKKCYTSPRSLKGDYREWKINNKQNKRLFNSRIIDNNQFNNSNQFKYNNNKNYLKYDLNYINEQIKNNIKNDNDNRYSINLSGEFISNSIERKIKQNKLESCK